jgi:hypothetical protein
MLTWKDRPAKDKARRYLFQSTRFASRRSLWMPAAECVDIQLAFEMGVLSRRSRIIAVEQDKAIFQRMRRKLRSIAAQHKLVHAPEFINAPLHTVTLNQSLDFAFIDLCGTCDARILLWMEQMLAPHLSQNADVAVTCTYAMRHSRFLQTCRNTLLEHWSTLYTDFGFQHNYWHPSSQPYEPITVPAILLKCAFHGQDVRMRQPYFYRDDYPMIAFKLSDVRSPGRSLYPAFSSLQAVMTQHAPVRMPMRLPAATARLPGASSDVAMRRRLAALKAVATRRQRQGYV